MSAETAKLEISTFARKKADELKKKCKWVYSVGVELEGGAPYMAYDAIMKELIKIGLEHRFEWGSDGSVDVPKPWYMELDWDYNAEVRFWVEMTRIEILFYVVETLWKLGFQQNETCGNHVHLDFYYNMHTISLIFNEKFVRKFENKYRIYARKKGEKYVNRIYNRYCSFYRTHRFPAALYYYRNSRYHAVNFISVDENNTLEIRILPHADNSKEYIEMLTWLVLTVDELVDKFIKSFKGVSVKIAFPKEELPKEEEIVEEVIV
jgi:hypothetical protein